MIRDRRSTGSRRVEARVRRLVAAAFLIIVVIAAAGPSVRPADATPMTPRALAWVGAAETHGNRSASHPAHNYDNGTCCTPQFITHAPEAADAAEAPGVIRFHSAGLDDSPAVRDLPTISLPLGKGERCKAKSWVYDSVAMRAAERAGDLSTADREASATRAGGGGGGTDVFHATTSPGAAQGVANGINPARLNPNSRFGRAFYAAESPGTALAEMAHHGASPTHGVRFSLNTGNARVLDLADSNVASAWGYSGGPISSATQAIGPKAVSAGFNTIRYPSLRGSGMNWAVLDDFDDLLVPQMITPTG